jgi:hypothetical protein
VEEEEAMVETRIISLKEIVITVGNKVMPKQPVGYFRAMRVKGLLGLNREKTEMRQVRLPQKLATKWSIY